MINKQDLIDCFPNGKTISLGKKEVICVPHQRVTSFYWLLKGTLDYYVTIERPSKSYLVNKISSPYTPIGWSGLNEPRRFAHTVVVGSKEATLFEVPTNDALEHVRVTSKLNLIEQLTKSIYDQIKESLIRQSKLVALPKEVEPSPIESYYITADSGVDAILELMRKSPFLEKFPDDQLLKLAQTVERRDYDENDTIYDQDTFSGGLFILIQGEVSIARYENNKLLRQRGISTPGFVFGWSSLIDQQDICSAITLHKSSVYLVSKESFENILNESPGLHKDLLLNLVWLIGNQLNAAFVRYVQLSSQQPQHAIQNIIESVRSKISVRSNLHRVSHLLKEPVTKPLAYEILHDLNKSGSPTERHAASLCLEFLIEDEKEIRFFNGLNKIYEIVAEDTELSPQYKRKECAKATRELFNPLDVHIEGKDNLPSSPGHIFIYNHLLNHPYYTLNNNFQITLDSHFISGMLLDLKYDQPGIRTVRVGKGQEYGHQNYYEQLGYINVYTKDSDLTNQEAVAQAREGFYQLANDYLSKGFNLIISPEGTSYSSEESPGHFKAGAFQLALQHEKNPLIVPVVLCHFDRRISNNLFYCEILEPLAIKDHVDVENPESIKTFVASYQIEFAKKVAVARKKANQLQERLVNE